MKSILILGTNTGIGKTHFSVLFSKYLIGRGNKVKYIKSTQTGYPKDDDERTVKQLINLDTKTIIKASEPIAPGAVFDKFPFFKLKEYIGASCDYNYVLIETAGGTCSPLDKSHLNYHIAKKLNIGVILVVPNRLGCISDAISNVYVLKKEGIRVYSIAMNNYFFHTKEQKNEELINNFCKNKIGIEFDKEGIVFKDSFVKKMIL